MMRLLVTSGRMFSTHLRYPYQFTNCPQQFKYYDNRFSEFPATRALYEQQKQHIAFVLKSFNKILSTEESQKVSSQDLKFIHPCLIARANNFAIQTKARGEALKFTFFYDQIKESKGYLEFYGAPSGLNIPENEHPKFIHEYLVDKKNEKVFFIEKQWLRKGKRMQKHLEEDLQEMLTSRSVGKKMREQIFGNKTKKLEKLNDVVEFFNSFMNKTKTKSSFIPYIQVDRVEGQMEVTLNNKTQNVTMTTKWLYEVNSEEPVSVKKSRRRILFDFQLWNRGSFIPVFQFS